MNTLDSYNMKQPQLNGGDDLHIGVLKRTLGTPDLAKKLNILALRHARKTRGGNVITGDWLLAELCNILYHNNFYDIEELLCELYDTAELPDCPPEQPFTAQGLAMAEELGVAVLAYVELLLDYLAHDQEIPLLSTADWLTLYKHDELESADTIVRHNLRNVCRERGVFSKRELELAIGVAYDCLMQAF